MNTLIAVMVTTLAAKLLVEGVHTLPKYCKTRGTTALGECSTLLSAMKAAYVCTQAMEWCRAVRAAQYSTCSASCHTYALMQWNVFSFMMAHA